MHDRPTDVRPGRAIVFVGPSATADTLRGVLPSAVVLPPVTRDQLYDARERGATYFLVVDGLFGQRLAVSPREVVDVLRDGAVVVGASSIGAVRAAECWPAGMEGVGLVFRLYRRGILTSDDEVAVSVIAEDDYAAASVPLVHVRYAMAKAARAGFVTHADAHAVIERCRTMHYAERTWEGLVDAEDLRAFCRRVDIKGQDAREAAKHLRRRAAAAPTASGGAHVPTLSLRPPSRYPGHDPLLGRSREDLAGELLRWLSDSGRYRKFAELRTRPPRAADAAAVWEILARSGELETELLRWYASTQRLGHI